MMQGYTSPRSLFLTLCIEAETLNALKLLLLDPKGRRLQPKEDSLLAKLQGRGGPPSDPRCRIMVVASPRYLGQIDMEISLIYELTRHSLPCVL